ncbi:MAG: nucleotide exchange factor GrpE [Deltaproteobacteria bacterium]|nr:nucleotide exchange factor GrpE [Deltaproteobacteria bacterium]
MKHRDNDSRDAALEELSPDENQEEKEPVSAGESEDAPLVTVPLSEYKELVEKTAEYKDLYLRTAADFDNYRKRMTREREDLVCYANERLVHDLLPILDNLERALESEEATLPSGSILEGVRMITGQLRGVLEKCGLERLSPVGEPFDPNIHEAVGVLPSKDHEEGTVVNELQRGYRFKGKVVRPSMVHVSGGKPTAPKQDEEK